MRENLNTKNISQTQIISFLELSYQKDQIDFFSHDKKEVSIQSQIHTALLNPKAVWTDYKYTKLSKQEKAIFVRLRKIVQEVFEDLKIAFSDTFVSTIQCIKIKNATSKISGKKKNYTHGQDSFDLDTSPAFSYNANVYLDAKQLVKSRKTPSVIRQNNTAELMLHELVHCFSSHMIKYQAQSLEDNTYTVKSIRNTGFANELWNGEVQGNFLNEGMTHMISLMIINYLREGNIYRTIGTNYFLHLYVLDQLVYKAAVHLGVDYDLLMMYLVKGYILGEKKVLQVFAQTYGKDVLKKLYTSDVNERNQLNQLSDTLQQTIGGPGIQDKSLNRYIHSTSSQCKDLIGRDDDIKIMDGETIPYPLQNTS